LWCRSTDLSLAGMELKKTELREAGYLFWSSIAAVFPSQITVYLQPMVDVREPSRSFLRIWIRPDFLVLFAVQHMVVTTENMYGITATGASQLCLESLRRRC
jgi:hypothetical protein